MSVTGAGLMIYVAHKEGATVAAERTARSAWEKLSVKNFPNIPSHAWKLIKEPERKSDSEGGLYETIFNFVF